MVCHQQVNAIVRCLRLVLFLNHWNTVRIIHDVGEHRHASWNPSRNLVVAQKLCLAIWPLVGISNDPLLVLTQLQVNLSHKLWNLEPFQGLANTLVLVDEQFLLLLGVSTQMQRKGMKIPV